MKFMEKLLVGEKVEWKKLGEVCELLELLILQMVKLYLMI